MVARSERLGQTLPVDLDSDSPGESRSVHQLSIAAIVVAALIAGIAVLFRSGPSDAIPVSAPSPTALAVEIALPGVGAGAPDTLAELRADGGPGTLLVDPSESAVAVTARRYATHLIADIVEAPRFTIAPLATTDAVQVAVTIANNPQLIRRAVVDDDEVLSESVLIARLGLEPGSALPPFFAYEIQRGDSVEKLARRFGITTESILFNNFEIGDPDFLEPGAQLTIPTQDGVVYTVRLGDTLFAIAENYASDVEDILAFEGNQLSSPDQLVEGATILLVGGSASIVFGFGSGGAVTAIPSFRWPLGGILTDFYGTPRGNRRGFHAGIDLSAPTGTFVGSSAPGIVVQAGWDGAYGNSVLVDHGGGVLTRYAHMSHIDVFLGEAVEPGSLIGFVGSSGYSTGPHLHFEIIMGGVPQDPLVWLNS